MPFSPAQGTLVQLVWPAELAVFYPYALVFSPLRVGGSALLLVLVSVLVAVSRPPSHQPYLAVGWFWYLVTLSPVLGLIQGGPCPRGPLHLHPVDRDLLAFNLGGLRPDAAMAKPGRSIGGCWRRGLVLLRGRYDAPACLLEGQRGLVPTCAPGDPE